MNHICVNDGLPRLAQKTSWGRTVGWEAPHHAVQLCTCGKAWRVVVRRHGVYVTRAYQPVKRHHIVSRFRAAIETTGL